MIKSAEARPYGARERTVKPSVALLGPSLGHGSYGTVHKGYVRGFPALPHLEGVAIAIKSPFLAPSEGPTGVPQMQLREVVAMSSVPPHPHIMPMHAGVVEEGVRGTGLHILMPCAQGTAKSSIKAKELSRREILQWSTELSSAVAHMHLSGWIHRDIKLENCMILNGSLLLGDLGLTRLSMMDAAMDLSANKSHDVQMTTDVCTETTRAPEVFLAESNGAPTTYSYGLPSDVWSVGACCLALASGGYVFRSSKPGARDALKSIWKLLGRPSKEEWSLVAEDIREHTRDYAPPEDVVEALRATAHRRDLPQEWWSIVANMLSVLPWKRMRASEAFERFQALCPLQEPSRQPEIGFPAEVRWQSFSGHSRVLLSACQPRSVSVHDPAYLRCMVACWDASRALALPPLAGIAAQLLLAKAQSHLIPSKHLAGACLSLAAKCCMFAAPTPSAVAAALRVSATVVARCEWQVLLSVGGQLLGEDLRSALRLWPPRMHQSLSGNPLSVCLVSALLALHPGTRICEAHKDAEIMLRGIDPGPDAQHARIARLVEACRSGECTSFFRAWPGAWADSTAAIRAWALSIHISRDTTSTAKPCDPPRSS